ncbi:hypothetical protein GNI_019820 [Gregarina niphandrodes]|uniref:Deubiquitinating enzyme MINDY-3/4 conserved domain-containing protein n=1 Tax=Gregarina niphandrodes TaxID=110365 RepID=A0A023BBV3_GRENI|nr:hypothetical protein GNI_019820 [Gregarina niphandrodes]EZG81159.1 hypothetical protein GNI_019820 [Gregarina niphandrodes]|eukprot:XP_011134255.1 hypothetical protein GNI_019820 [Gregarina niphandrodes]
MSGWIDRLVDDPNIVPSLFPSDPYLGRLGDVSRLPHCKDNRIQEDCKRLGYSNDWVTGFTSLHSIISDLTPEAKETYRAFWEQEFQPLTDPTELWEVLLGQNAVETRYLARWLRHPILFYQRTDTPWLLMQLIGGPCGVISVLQSHMFAALLFSPNSQEPISQEPISQEPNSQESMPKRRAGTLSMNQKLSSATPWGLRAMVSAAIARIIWQCRPRGGDAALCCLDALDAVKGGSVSELHTRSASAMTGRLGVGDLLVRSRVFVRVFGSYVALASFVCDHLLTLFCGPQVPGCLNLVLSCVHTRGARKIAAEDFDPFNESSLLADFGHCSQEMVNLLLTGAATPNTFDGDRAAAGVLLKGIAHHSALGQLSDMERYSVVGVRMKKPVLPVWVVAKNYHYSTLCNLNVKSHKLHASELVEERLEWYWQEHERALAANADQGISGTGAGGMAGTGGMSGTGSGGMAGGDTAQLVEGMLSAQQATALCESLGVENAAQVVTTHLLDREIRRVLRERFLTWGAAHVDQIPKLVEDLVTPLARIRLLPDEKLLRGPPCYLYADGQLLNLSECADDTVGSVLAKPTAVRVLVPSNLVIDVRPGGSGSGAEDTAQIHQLLGYKEGLTIFDFTVHNQHV